MTLKPIRDTRPEKEIEHAGDKAMAMLGFSVVRFSQSRATMQTAGIPDRRYYHAGRRLAFWWEAKTARGEQSGAQLIFQTVAEACGEHYALGTDDDLAAFVVALLNKYPIR